MSASNDLKKLCENLVNECISCHHCITECQLLQQIGEDIPSLAERGPTIEEAYSCSLCGLCEAICPSSLSIKNLFAETRKNAVKNGLIDINEYRYMFPDRKYNVMSMFREINGIHYQDLNPNQQCSTCFFPGCTLLTYSPELTRNLHFELKNVYKEISLITDCCGMPLAQLGLQSRCQDYITFVLGKLLTLQVKELVVACPNCYYQLLPLLKDVGIKIVTIYEALKDSPLINRPLVKNRTISVTIHDSCPDRFHDLFASQSRKALLKKGYTIVEMKRSHDNTVCCGSGGQVTHFQPELAQNVVLSRLEEAENTEADILTAYCLGCILNFSKIPVKMQVQHVLNLLLGLKQDFSGLKAKAKVLFTGPKGEECWQRIMADE